MGEALDGMACGRGQGCRVECAGGLDGGCLIDCSAAGKPLENSLQEIHHRKPFFGPIVMCQVLDQVFYLDFLF